MDFLLFISSASGLVLVLNKSMLFKPLREYFSRKKDNKVWWFVNSLFMCSLCMGVWVSLPVYFVLNTEYYWIMYAFSGALFAYFLTTIMETLARK